MISIKSIPGYANLIDPEMLIHMNDILKRDTAKSGGVIDQRNTMPS